MVRIGRVTVRVNVMDRFNGRTRARVGISECGMSEIAFQIPNMLAQPLFYWCLMLLI